jgi:hypothetical protein
MKKNSWESEAVPPVSKNFVIFRQNFCFLFFTGETYKLLPLLRSRNQAI